jgi:hypothetical protein
MTLGVKGSAVYTPAAVGDPRIVLSTKLVRGAEPADIQEWFDALLVNGSDEMILDAAVMLFQTRDIRGGKGERALFHILFQSLLTRYPTLAESLLSLIPEYGSWKDVFVLFRTAPTLSQAIFRLVLKQLETDEAAAANGEPISLMAKWAPRERKAGEAEARRLARMIEPTGNACARYRKRMANLNRILQTVETYECADRWDEIVPKHVPARARELKMAAYLNERSRKDHTLRKPSDEKRMACREHFRDFFAAAAAGKERITGTETLYPHEIVKKMAGADVETEADAVNAWNAVWQRMVEKAQAGGDLGSSIAMCDFSGSMLTSHRTKDLPYWVSMAMGLLIASANSGPFQGRFLTFDSTPTWHPLPVNATLQTAVATISSEIGQGLSTNFEKAMELILTTLEEARVRPGDEPKNLIVITDMGFDAANSPNRSWETHLERIRRSFQERGEELWGSVESGGLGGWTAPRIVIWNVAASYSDDFHAQAQTEGVLLLSGWSPSLFKIICEEGPRCITPYEGLRAQLDGPRYDPVRVRVGEWLAGGWRDVV